MGSARRFRYPGLAFATLAACAPPPGPQFDYAGATALIDMDAQSCKAASADLLELSVCFAGSRQTRFKEAGAPLDFLAAAGEIDAYMIEQVRAGKQGDELLFLVNQKTNEVEARYQARVQAQQAQQQQAALAALAVLSQPPAYTPQPALPLRTTCTRQGIYTNCTTQ